MAIMGTIDKRLWCRSPRTIASLTKSYRCGGPVLRLAILIAAASAALWLNCGTSQAGRGLTIADNPYCGISTYTMRDVPEQAMSLLDSNGRPVIVVSSLLLNQTPAYGHFLLAHECCHHTLGHVQRYQEEFGHVGPHRSSISRRS